MKMFIKSSLVVVIASAAMISCIDNTVSPEVQQLRAGQVALLTAKTAWATADAEFRQAQADSQKEQVREDKASADKAEADALTDIKAAQLALQKATDGLAEYIASHNLHIADSLLGVYTDATDEIGSLAIKRVGKQHDIAVVKYYIKGTTVASDGTVTAGPVAGETLDLVKGELQRTLAHDQADLDAANAALTLLQGIGATPTKADAQAQLNAAIADSSSLGSVKRTLKLQAEKLTQATAVADRKVVDAQTTINTFEALDVDAIDVKIADSTAILANINANLTTQNSVLAAKTTAWNNAKTDYNAKVTTHNKSESDSLKAANAHDLTVAAVTLATAKLDAANEAANADPGNTAKADAVDAAQGVLDDANDAESDAADALSDASDIAAADFTNLFNAKAAVATAKAAVDGVQSDVDDLTDAKALAEKNLNSLNAKKAGVQAKITASQSAYDAAVAGIGQLRIDAATAKAAEAPVSAQQTINTAAITNTVTVIQALQAYVKTGGGIDIAIEKQKTAVYGFAKAVAASQKALDDNAISKEEADAYIARLEADLADIDAQIAIQTAIAAKNKTLLDAALAG